MWHQALLVATSRYQYVLSIWAGCECISCASGNATVFSVDGISAFDWVSLGAMLQVLQDVSSFALSGNSMATLPVISGKVMKVLSMRLTRAKAGRTHAFAVLIFATRTTGSRSMAVATSNCGDTQESGSTMARHKCGTSLE